MAEDKLENGQEQKAATTVENNAEETPPADNKVEQKDDVKKTSDKVKTQEDDKAEANIETEEKNNETVKEKQKASPELLKKIKNQVEFYFGDVNMQRDKFLIEQVKLDEGWVPLSVMLNFKMLAALSKDIEIILKALENSELIEVSDDAKKIRRSLKMPLPVYDEEYKKAQEERSVYIKGFPQENMTITMLKEFLGPYEPIEHIFMRRYVSKNDKACFKGSIFVQFATLDAAKYFMALESVKYNNTELIRKWSKDYSVEKAQKIEEHRAKRDKKKGKEIKNSDKEDKEKENEKSEQSLPKGTILHIAELVYNVAREEIKEQISKHKVNVVYIEYNKGDTDAYVRLQEENDAKNVFEKLKNGKLTLSSNEYQCRVLEGEEEDKYLEKVKQEIKNVKMHKNNRSRGQGHQKRQANNPSINDIPKKKAKN